MSFHDYDALIIDTVKQRIYASMSYNAIDLDLNMAKTHVRRIFEMALERAEEEIENDIMLAEQRVKEQTGREYGLPKELKQAIAASNLRKCK
ncbi:hypothetical protein NCTGTJJY_CDS0075 [Serratia phage 92A1]|nr:hypothetical protein NCTGTJJY_CDS0075 [Serratia phage 92A1]